MKYTKEQSDAINFGEGTLQIIACAGSGKTEVIARRITKLIVQDEVPPSQILAFTFTEKAAEFMKRRIYKYLQEERGKLIGLGDMFVGTIHSFCFQQLQYLFPEFGNYDVLDEYKKPLFIWKYYKELELDKLSTKLFTHNTFDFISKVIRNIDVVYDNLILLQDLKKKAPDFYSAFERYTYLKKKLKVLEFGEMISKFIEHLKRSPDILVNIREKYKYIIVDEYQDINPAQEELIKLLSMGNNLCVVGDDDQCIYQWRGTDINNILNFNSRYHKSTILSLSKNFRSTNGIINIATSVIKRNHGRLSKKMEEYRSDYEEGDIYICRFSDREKQVEFAVSKIKELYGTDFIESDGIKRALTYGDFAILVRRRKDAKPFVNALNKEKIPFNVIGYGGLFAREEIRGIVEIFRWFSNESEDWKVKNALEKNLNLKGREKIFLELRRMKKNIQIFNKNLDLQKIYHQIVGVLNIPFQKENEIIFYNLGMFSQLISDYQFIYGLIPYKHIKSFIKFLDIFAKDAYPEGITESFYEVDAINIMTVHQAKGLEFPIVFIPFVEKDLFPIKGKLDQWIVSPALFDARRYKGDIEDERRLFYVALTRAKKFLFVSYIDNKPSEFIDEIFTFADEKFYLKENIITNIQRNRTSSIVKKSIKLPPISITSLKYYLQCPFGFKIRFLYGFNPIMDVALGYGKTVHNLIKIISEKKSIPLGRDLDTLIDEYFYLRYAYGQAYENLKNGVKAILSNFLEKHADKLLRVIESEKPFEYPIGDAIFVGRVDSIENEKDNTVNIVDYKVEKDFILSEFEKLQVQFYALVFKEIWDFPVNYSYIHNLSNNHRYPIKVKDEELKKVKQKLQEISKDIEKGNFVYKPGKEKCRYCDFKSFCPFRYD
jgi:DNA helicase-2/ATP-dependent DNA helicase PcrA